MVNGLVAVLHSEILWEINQSLQLSSCIGSLRTKEPLDFSRGSFSTLDIA